MCALLIPVVRVPDVPQHLVTRPVLKQNEEFLLVLFETLKFALVRGRASSSTYLDDEMSILIIRPRVKRVSSRSSPHLHSYFLMAYCTYFFVTHGDYYNLHCVRAYFRPCGTAERPSA